MGKGKGGKPREDITESKRAEEAPRQLKEFHESIVQNMSEGVVVEDAHGYITFVNPAALALLGYDAEELVGQHWRVIIPVDQQPIVKAADERRVRGESDHYEVEVVRKDKARLSVLVHGSPLFEGKKYLGTIAVFTDITARKQAEKEAQRRLERLMALREIDRAISSSLDLRDRLDVLLDKLTDLPHIDGVAVMVLKPDTKELETVAIRNLSEEFAKMAEARLRDGLPQLVAEREKPLVITDLMTNARVVHRELFKREELASYIGLPLLAKGELIGVLGTYSRERHRWSQEQTDFLHTLAGRAAIAIENARLYEEATRRLARLRALREIDRAISSSLELKDRLDVLLDKLTELPHIDGVSIVVLNPDTEEVVTVAIRDLSEEFAEMARVRLRDGLPGLVAEREKPLVITDLLEDERVAYPDLLEREGLASYIGLPLLAKGELIGVLGIYSRERHLWSQEQSDFLHTLAGQAAIALENARLYDKVQKHLKEMTTLQRVGMELTSSLDLSSLLQGIADSTLELTNADYVHLFSLEPETGEFTQRAASWRPEAKKPPITWPRKKGLTAAVLEAQEPVVIEKATDHPLYSTPEARKWGVQSVAGFPLQGKWGLTGVLNVVFLQPHLFSEEKLSLLSLLADQAAIAIENARLYEDTQRHLERVTALREIDQAISSTLDLPEVLVITLEQLERLVPHHSAAIYLLTDDTAKVIAASGVPDLDRAMQVSFQVSEDALARQLLEERRPLVLAHAQADERFQARGGTEYVRSWVGVPLIVRGEAIGFLTIDHREPGVYDEESGEMALSFANQVAIAIENARAYERLKTQNLETISALAAAVEAKDPYTSGHSEKVTQFAIAIAEKMGLADDEIETLRFAGLLHDIGKIGIPDSVLNKPARLTSAERIMINSHPVVSAEIVGKIEALAHLVPVIRHHHERWDGKGYPDGLKGEKIPLGARILAVADGFEAMTSERPYRFAKSQEEAVEELKAGAGTQWDPKVVKVFVKHVKAG